MYSYPSYTGAGGTQNGPPSQYGQPAFIQQQQQVQGQETAPSFGRGLAAQPTGFSNAASLGNPSQPSYNARDAHQNQAFPNSASFQPVPTGRNTGQTSSEIAQSLGAMDSPGLSSAPSSSVGVKIPSDRLSFLTLDDQIKFTNLFRSAVGNGQALDGKLQETSEGSCAVN